MSDEKITKKESSILPVEASERGTEYPIIDFNYYTEVCNYQNDGSRLRGILSSELYKTIIEDPNTSFIKSSGHRIPVLMDVSYGPAMGYDTAKCEEYAKGLSANIKILTLPIHELNDDEKSQLADIIVSGDNFALFFNDHNNDESNTLRGILDKIGVGHIEKPLIDSRAAKGDEQAAVLLFSCLVEQNSSRGERKQLRLSDVQDYYEKNIGPYITPDGESRTTLEMGDKISDEQAEEMWKLFDNRFNFLGANHPLSMQDSKEDFLGLLRISNTLIAASFTKSETGKLDQLTCFTYFVDDTKCLYWLNRKYLDEEFAMKEGREHITNIYTPGIVSSGIGRSYSMLSIGLYAKTADEAGLSANVLFENTNLSKKYIPRIVDSAIKNSCKYSNLTPSCEVDKETYRLWAIGNEAE